MSKTTENNNFVLEGIVSIFIELMDVKAELRE